MKAETFIVKICGMLIIAYFLFDARRKFKFADDTEGERVRIKFT
jgi:hypothetical protein